MKIWLISLAILSSFIILGIFFQNNLQKSSARLTAELRRIETLVEDGRWNRSNSKLIAFKNNWRKTKSIWAIFTHHQEIDYVEEALSKAAAAVRSRSEADSLIELGVLRHFLTHIPQRERFNITNLF